MKIILLASNPKLYSNQRIIESAQKRGHEISFVNVGGCYIKISANSSEVFYDEGKNEYDYAINLDNIAKWLELRKGHLKDLLVSNFIEDQDYIILEKPKGKGRGIGSNNVKPVYLTYTCAKLLCMISRSEKAALIRNYYIDLEKLLIKYKEEIVDSLNQQLGIKKNNKKVIEKNKQSGLIYVLKVDDETFKIGRTGEIKKRLKQYNVGKLYELPIVFVYKTDDILNIEKCIKDNLKQYQAKNNTELYKIDINFINDTVKYCTKKNALLLKKNIKLINDKSKKNWLIIIDKKNIDNINDLYKVKKK